MNGIALIFLMSLVPIPLTYVLNTLPWMQNPWMILVAGVTVLSLLVVVPYLTVRKMARPDFILYVMSLFMFSSVIDLMIALESDGVIAEFVMFYLQDGEPYLKTAYGTMINYWDGLVHYGLCLMILAAIAWSESYRQVGLYWVGSITNSLLVLVPGSVLGMFGVKPAILLNIPYLVVPVWIGYRLLAQRKSAIGKQKSKRTVPSIWRRPVDLLFFVYFMVAMAADLFRGFASLGCQETITRQYITEYEPYLQDPTTYPKVQMLVYMFYFVPYYVCAMYGLLHPGQSWMTDWSLLYAGAAAQGQFSHIGGSLHARTPYKLRVPTDHHIRLVFWCLNLSLFLIPQLFAYRQVKMNNKASSDVDKSN